MKREWHPIKAAVLAGGESRRMGQDKAMLQLQGQTLIQRTIDLLGQFLGEVFVVSNSPEHSAVLDCPVFQDIFPGHGPIGGIHSALVNANAGHVLVVACDMPFLTPEVVQYLRDHGPGHRALVVESERGAEPLCAVYARECLDVVEARIGREELKLQDLLVALEATHVPIGEITPGADRDPLMNVNTPEELERARQP